MAETCAYEACLRRLEDSASFLVSGLSNFGEPNHVVYQVENAELTTAHQSLRSMVERASSSPDNILEKCKKQRVERITLTDKAIVETVGHICVSLGCIAQRFVDEFGLGHCQRRAHSLEIRYRRRPLSTGAHTTGHAAQPRTCRVHVREEP